MRTSRSGCLEWRRSTGTMDGPRAFSSAVARSRSTYRVAPSWATSFSILRMAAGGGRA